MCEGLCWLGWAIKVCLVVAVSLLLVLDPVLDSCFAERVSPSLPSCKADAAGRKKIRSIHPWHPGASHPVDPCLVLLHTRTWIFPTLQGTTAAGAAGGHQTFIPLWHFLPWDAEGGHPSCFALAMVLAEYLDPFCSAVAFYMHLSYLSVADHCTS